MFPKTEIQDSEAFFEDVLVYFFVFFDRLQANNEQTGEISPLPIFLPEFDYEFK